MNRLLEVNLTAGLPIPSLDVPTFFAENADAKAGMFAEPDLIAVKQYHRRRMAGIHVAIHLRRDALADLFAVDEGAIETAEIADAKGRRHDFEDTVVTRYIQMLHFLGKGDRAIARTADETGRRFRENKRPTDERSASKEDRNIAIHDSLP